MKGPFERLKYDMRRIWECPECHHKERTDGTTTTVVCRCQAKKEVLDRVVMKLVEDRAQRRFPEFVPPTAEDYGMVEADEADTSNNDNVAAEVAVATEAVSKETAPDGASPADEPPSPESSDA